jgi:fucose 4-O-acetylase-like acetyltransferase
MSFGIINLYENESFLADMIKFIAHGGTSFFVFISGYLLHHIYYRKLKVSSFFKKKIKYVLLPFLFFSSIDIIYYLVRLLSSYFFHIGKYEIYFNKIKSLDLIKIYLLGHTDITIGLWYIPFIMVIFSLSSIYLRFVSINLKNQVLIIIFLFLLSVIINRTYEDRISGIFQNVIYFSPVYLLGIFVSSNHQVFYDKMIGKEFYLLFTALIISILQIKISKIENNLDFSFIDIQNFDLMIIQKSVLSIFFILFLKRTKYPKTSFINILALNSFGIFFIHGFFIWIIKALVLRFKITFISNSIILYLLTASLVLVLSLLSSIFIRRIFSHYSKYIIGC